MMLSRGPDNSLSQNFGFFVFFILNLILQSVHGQNCFGYETIDPLACSGNGVCYVKDGCSCKSGYFGATCSEIAPSSCTWNTVDPSKTDFYPVIDTTTLNFDNSDLVFSIKSPLVKRRLDTHIYIEKEQYRDCSFPGEYATATVDLRDGCFALYNFHIPWGVASKCGWTISKEEDDLTYKAKIYLRQIEEFDILRNQFIKRDILRVIPIEVRLKTTLDVASKVLVIAPVTLKAALTKQEFIPGAPNRGSFDLLTSLQYPFVLDLLQGYGIDSAPKGITPSLLDVSDPLECLPNQVCKQKFKIPLLVNGTCSLTGDYYLLFRVGCHSSVTDPKNCPIQPGNNLAKLLISINSENFCLAANVDIGLSGMLESYSDSTYNTIKTSFFLEEMSYFQAKIFSPKASLREASIWRVQWSNENVSRVLFDSGKVTTDGNLQKFQLGPNGGYTAAFVFQVGSFMNPNDGYNRFNISTVLKVVYDALEGVTSPTKYLGGEWTSQIQKGGENLGENAPRDETFTSLRLANSQNSKIVGSILLSSELPPHDRKRFNGVFEFTVSFLLAIMILICTCLGVFFVLGSLNFVKGSSWNK